ncbi:glutamine--fructose-6-phosphate transaminase (isomerizing) [Candidatus Bathyarchaeota archaeon]|nr:glutamine--fructose-6-phosphate transaminase (isomerizing) [Candidatus Bathyarchaeota archaeon]
MCGIFGCILKKGLVAPQILDGLKRLEYRGYDSIGVATLHSGIIEIRKDKGTIQEVTEKLKINEMKGTIGIGHTRWATHGAPNMINAHPHTDTHGKIAVIHNGVIENFLELKQELIEKGHIFLSKTDTEIIPHLIEEELKQNKILKLAILNALKRLIGSYALAVISSLEPDKIICARYESPLVLGISNDGLYCASDVPAIRPYTNKVIYLRNGELATLKVDGYEIIKISDSTVIHRDFEEIEWTLQESEKQDYDHYMLKEIFEQPISLKNGLWLQEQYVDLLTQFLDRGKEVLLLGAGTSNHACIAGSYIFSKLARLTAYPVISSEFIECYGSSIGIDSVILAVSQSGETYDTLKAVDHARMRAATVLGLTNTVGSTLTRVSRAYLIQQSGPEIGVAATKTFTSQVIVLTQIALKLAKLRGKLSQDELDEYEKNLYNIPYWVETVLNRTYLNIKSIAKKYKNSKLFLFLGRGISSATAMEGRLKLLEITYIPCLAYPAGESKHGPISVVEEKVPCVFICPKGSTRSEIIGSIMEIKARGARIISICEEGDSEIIQLSDDVVEMPKGIPDLLSPIPYIVPLQLLSYELALIKKLDPDKPRNLAKSVTVP